MQLKNVQLFCDVVAKSSFSRAAEGHRISQSAASQAVQVLEDHVGTVLIDRSKRPLELTPAGQLYYDGCRKLLESFRRIEDRVHQLSDRVTGRLAVAAIYSVGLLEMADRVNHYRERYSEVDLQLSYLHPDEVYERVRNDDVDLGIVSFPRDGSEFRSVAWQRQPMVLVTAPAHRLAGSRSVRVEELSGEPFVAFRAELAIRRQVDRWLKQARVTVKMVHEFDNCENIKRAVEIGSGIAVLPVATVARETESGSLISISLADADWVRPLGFIHRKHREPTVAAERFIELLKEPDNGV